MKAIINLYNNSDWIDATEYPESTKKKVLRDEKGAKTLLLKLPKGFYMASHAHIMTEQHFILQG